MSRHGPHAQSFAIPDGALDRVLQEMITPIASIPETERIGYFRGWERLSREPQSTVGGYNRQKMCGAAMRIANIVWADWPPQTSAPRAAARGMQQQATGGTTAVAGDPSVLGGSAVGGGWG
jgi:hypothetical protein